MNEDYLSHVSKIDHSIISDITKKYWNDVWNYAFLITKDYDQSNDIAQDVFVKAFKSIDSYRGEGSVKTWLLVIARNTAYSYLRSAFFRKVTVFAVVHSNASVASAEKEFFEKNFINEIWKAVMDLPRHYREVIVLDAQLEMSIDEISKFLSVSQGTVKSRIHRARKMLTKKLKEEVGYVRK
ncbi:RNA polymerase sigma factor [Paenibacillus sp. GCM10012303]|uniref:RNA polymerase sigma factor n=1 Tax=Paenibacillus sp. GCM10012303 TaxID=3317340 RepID=UPI00361C125B